MIMFYIILSMIFLHIVDDYYLQGCLASMKQKVWWKKNYPNELYKYDYIWALIMHSFSWTFMIMLPIVISMSFKVGAIFIILFFVNIIIHAVTDNAKANKGCINLWQDQLIHMIQIIATGIILCN